MTEPEPESLAEQALDEAATEAERGQVAAVIAELWEKHGGDVPFSDWKHETRKAADGRTDVQYWTREAWEIEKHPFSDKYMLTHDSAFAGIYQSLAAAQNGAES